MHQKLILIGNVGKEPEMRYTPSGTAVTKLSLATNREYKDQGGNKVKETTWWSVTCWGKLAEVVSQYVHKGKKIYVEGRIEPDPNTGGPRIWTRSDGSAGASFEVNAEVVRFLDPPSGGRGDGDGDPYSAPTSAGEQDEFPF